MLINFIKYLMTLTAGLIIGYFVFTQQEKQPIDDNTSHSENFVAVADYPANTLEKTNQPAIQQSAQTELTDDKKLIDNLKNQIGVLQEKIAELETTLSQQQIDQIAEEAIEPQDQDSRSIETLSMKDFEKKIKNQFLDRFKGYAIELEGERLDNIKKEFNKDSSKANWNADYEYNINNFIQNNDPNRLHYVDELTCTSNMCRLKISSSFPNKWQQLFLTMTQQSWYNSITLSENSGEPNVFIYFITQPQNVE